VTADVVVPYPDYSVPIERPYVTVGITAADGYLLINATDYLLIANTFLNPGFETAGGGGADIWASWTEAAGGGVLADEVVQIHSGAHACKETAGAAIDTYVRQDFAVAASTQYTVSFWTRGDGVHDGGYQVYDVTHAADIIARTATGVTGGTYTQVAVTFTTPAGCVVIAILLWCSVVNGGVCYFDDIDAGDRLLIRGGSQIQSPRVDVPYPDYSIATPRPEWA